METYYLIDFENVHTDGLEGCETLKNTDHIVIFFTQNAINMDMRAVVNCKAGDVSWIEVPAGKQSLDNHIGTYMGYLAGKNQKDGCSIVIISKDTDYDNLVKFCKDRFGVKASRKAQIKKATATTSAKATTTAAKTTTKTTAKASGEEKTKVNNEVIKILRKAKYADDVVNYTTSTVLKHYNEDKAKQTIYRAIVSKYGQEKGLKIYNLIKKSI